MKCSFCGKIMDKGIGKIFVKKEGNVFSFCSKKCEKNLLKLKRNPRNVKWTQESRKQKQLVKGERK